MPENKEISARKENLSKIARRQQGKAANPELSVWVEASAGTGKTKVLSDRVLRLLLDGVEPTKILCLTYTKAAAVEMNARISARLAKWAVIADNELDEELEKLLESFPDKKQYDMIIARARTLFATLLDVPGGMKIQTIHSFCQEILKRFPLEAGISPYFSVMDDRMSAEALDKICQELILEVEQAPETETGQAISYLTRHIREFKFPELLKTLADNRNKLTQMLSGYKNFADFLHELSRRLNVREDETEETAHAEFYTSLNKDIIEKAAGILMQGSKQDKNNGTVLYEIIKKYDYEKYKNVFLTQDGKIRATLAHKEAVKIYPEITEVMQNLAQEILILEEKLLRIRLYASTRAVMVVAARLSEAYHIYKQKNARLDYEDLIVITRKLLEDKNVADWVLFKLDGGISHVLIDEAQDTSPNQWAIVKALTAEFFAGLGREGKKRTVFAVGDRKQSIYSFQGADPEEFDRMRRYFSKNSADFSTVRLDVSFRSTKAVLETVNNLFSLPEAASGVVAEGKGTEHIPYRLGEAGRVEIWPLAEGEEESEDIWYPPVERHTKISASTRLAGQIARKISQMVKEGELLASKGRPLQYGDFMVLVQRRNSFMEEFVRECKKEGVAVTGVDKLKLLEQIAVEDLLSLGRFLLLPQDDLSLAEILKSPLFGLTDDDLFKLCYNRGNMSLWSRLNADKAYQEPASVLSALLNRADYIRPFELYSLVLSTLDGRKKFVARLGAEAEDALDEFINLTLRFEEEHIPNLQNFLAWITADDIEVKRELEQAEDNAVRIMTVHGSKGLQAPVVILPDTVRLPNIKKSAGLMWDKDNMAYYPLSGNDYDAGCTMLYEQEKNKAFDEYRRLLYVALTRAEDRLYICGYKGKNNPDERSWYELCRKTLEECGNAEADGSLSYTCAQENEVAEEKRKALPKEETPTEPWLWREALEESPLAKPYTPSHPDDEELDLPAASPLVDNGKYYRRGLLMHRLLQFLPADADITKKDSLIDSFLQKNAADMPSKFHRQIKTEILRILTDNKFKFIFGPGSRAEVPVMGEVDGRIVSAQIDRLVISKDKITVVDFKTNCPPAETTDKVPAAYKKQLAVYKQLIEKIYPGYPVETFILWTNSANLMKIA